MNSKPNKKKKTAKERQAFSFMCLLLSAVILFVASVCLFITKRNKKIEAGEGITVPVSASVSVAETKAQKETSKEKQKEKPTETTEKETEKATEKPKKKAEEKNNTTTVKAEKTTAESKASKSTGGSIENPKLITIDEDKWYLTLVNRNYRIPDDYSPDLVTVCGTSERLEKRVAEEYEKMFEAAAKDGVYLTPCSGYRSYELQKNNYENETAYYENLGYSHKEALVKAATVIMPPGSSEHNLGYAMDIVCVEEWFEDTDEFAWLMKNAQNYGFILRYASDKTDITNVIYEPWHWRYVGVEEAKKIKASGKCLEEYLGIY